MDLPEVVLDRWIKAQSSQHPALAGYLGKLDLEKVESSSRPFLRLVQDTMNSALQSENANASDGVKHPPFHFDYIQVKNGAKNARNALAFQHEGYSFIVVTLPLVELLWELSQRLVRSTLVIESLGLHVDAVRPEAIQALLFQFQLSFLVSHEYTHHTHRHVGDHGAGVSGIWTEFLQDDARGGIDSQAEELDADAYAIYLVLANYLRGGGRQSALTQLGRRELSDQDADDLLFNLFFLALIALFCALWPADVGITSIYELGHPPAPVRIEYAKRVARMWCGQNASIPQTSVSDARVQVLFRAALEAPGGTGHPAWDGHIAFLRSAQGTEYDRKLLERFEAIRRGRHESSAQVVDV